MNDPVVTIEADGTYHFDCDGAMTVRVALHKAHKITKKCPVELLVGDLRVLSTDCNLRSMPDIGTMVTHLRNLRQDPGLWLVALHGIAALLPDTAEAPWTSVVRTLSDYDFERKRYLWFPVIPEAEPVSVEGDPGSGKSAAVVKLICHLTTGTRFPTLFPDRPEEDFTPRPVVLFSSEDDPSTTIKLRVALNGGNAELVHIVEGKRSPETGEIIPFTLADLSLISDVLTTYAPALMVFDPLQSYFGMADMNQASETRPTLDAVRAVCKTHSCTPLYVRHNGKTQRSKAIHASLGSIDITAHMRSVLALFKDPDDETLRILAQAKTNGRLAPSMKLKLVGATCDVPIGAGMELLEDVRVDWDGLSDLTAEDLNAREQTHGGDTEEANSALDQAREFLLEVLKDGPVLVEDIQSQAGKAGVTKATLRRAKDKEHIKAIRQVTNGSAYTNAPWAWQMTRYPGLHTSEHLRNGEGNQ